VKLLFDENISPKLPALVAVQFPESVHVSDCGLKGQSDQAVWDYARDHGFTIVSKDSDFSERSVLFGPPPKIVWLCLGNCSRDQVLNLLLARQSDIQALETAEESVLVLT
jgi:predicted nuclease of predicted toxin-antitoxin system